MRNNSFVKVAAISPILEVANPMFNIKEIINEINKLKSSNPHFIVLPELCITGYTCHDLFLESYLIEENDKAIQYLLKNNQSDSIIILGTFYLFRNNLFNCAYVINKDKILGIVPKEFLPNYDEFYEKRYFCSGRALGDEIFYVSDYDTYFGNLLFHEKSKNMTFGVEVCEDMWAPITPSSYLSIHGGELIFNVSASNETLDKDVVRRYTIQGISRRNSCAYMYVSSGRYESSQDTVFSNHNLIVQNGTIIKESTLFSKDSCVIMGDIDLGKLKYLRRKNSTLKDSLAYLKRNIKFIEFDNQYDDTNFKFTLTPSKTPFVPIQNVEEKFHKILDILVASLAKRIQHIKSRTVVLGLSGGLDSTVAYLVLYKTYMFLNKQFDIMAVTLPGLGTSERTLTNAINLGISLGIDVKTIDIKPQVLEMFNAIEHDITNTDVTYENAQARNRTAILMNLSNKHNGFVLGTGDLSELALGWATFNGDQMSNYSINGGMPKTLIKFMVKGFADFVFQNNELLRTTLYDILDTPISPELQSQSQKTEDVIGKYEVNDFIIYRFLVCGDSEERIKFLLKEVFTDLSDCEIDHYLKTFFRRFFSQQFKRSSLPDGPKVIDISLSPRTDWRMPTDAKYID